MQSRSRGSHEPSLADSVSWSPASTWRKLAMSGNSSCAMDGKGLIVLLVAWGNVACSQGSAPAASNVTPAAPPSVEPPPVPVATPLPMATLGERELLLDSGALGLNYFPDEGTASLDGPVGSGPVRLILTSGTTTFLVEGDSLH